MDDARREARWSLPEDLRGRLAEARGDWDRRRGSQRLWGRDASLWTGADEDRWLGWLEAPRAAQAAVADLQSFAAEVRAAEFRQALLMGMGGSSLGPEVLATSLGPAPGHPELQVLDSTDPAQVRAAEVRLDLERSLFLVASKSGTTLESRLLQEYFFDRVRGRLGGEAGARFVAVTDPGSQLARQAEEARYRRLFLGEPTIGGRYSVLSAFGLVPAAVLGLDLAQLVGRAQAMAEACGPEVPTRQNPGVELGLFLAEAARAGRDKLTLVASPRLRSFGAWVEQLVAESTGKRGVAILPVDGEALGPPGAYGEDRVFVHIEMADDEDAAQRSALEELAAAGHPVLRLRLAGPYDLAGEFFRWEIATAVAGAVLGINPFDQPDVEASKVETKKLTEEVERAGSLPAEEPFFDQDGVQLYTDARNTEEILRVAASERTLAALLGAHLARLGPGDYFAVLAFVAMNAAHRDRLQAIRHAVRDSRRVATCLGFGPRYLHSTGQAYKGGPDTGVFLQVTCDDAEDLPVPGRRVTFGQVKAAQARGDFAVLAERGRRALRVHLPADVEAGLQRLLDAMRAGG